MFEFSTPESLLDIDWNQPVFTLADRISIGPDAHQRIVDTVEACYRESGEAVFENAATHERLVFSESVSFGKYDNIEFREPEPILFSFNSPAGACPRCQGFGNTIDYSQDLIVPNRGLSLDDGAVEPWTKPKGAEWMAGFRKQVGNRVRFKVPFCDLTDGEQRLVLEGERKVDGVRQFFDFLETKKYKLHVRVFLSRYRGYARCPECAGSRLRKEALNVKVNDRTIAQAVRMNIAEAHAFFERLDLTPEEAGIAGKILVEIQQRLKFLNDVGLRVPYARSVVGHALRRRSTADSTRDVSGIATRRRLLCTRRALHRPPQPRYRATAAYPRASCVDIGNTILVVEHDPDVMRAADHVIDLGPGAGEHGGQHRLRGQFRFQLMADKNKFAHRRSICAGKCTWRGASTGAM